MTQDTETVDRDGATYPVNPVTRVEPNRSYPDAAILVIEDCVRCGDRHTHGLPDASNADVGYTTRRGSHCDDGEDIVKITEETDINV